MKNKEDIYKITGIVLIIDQLVKLIINNSLKLHQEIKLIPNFFSLYYVKNTGAAFSILENNTTFLIIITVFYILIINHFLKQEKHFTKKMALSLGLILGGIFGNLIDRILYHSVIDYLSFTIFKYDFPIFNIADIGIVVGVILFLYSFIEKNKLESKGAKKNE